MCLSRQEKTQRQTPNSMGFIQQPIASIVSYCMAIPLQDADTLAKPERSGGDGPLPRRRTVGAARPSLRSAAALGPNKADPPSIEASNLGPAGPPERARPRPRERSDANRKRSPPNGVSVPACLPKPLPGLHQRKTQ